MKADRLKITELMKQFYDGNYSRFAKDLEVDTSQLHRFLTTGVGGGKKIVGAIIKFCISKGINFEEYIEL